MSIFLKTDANVSEPLVTMPYIEDDYAIIRNVTLAMFDWSNEKTYSGSGNIAVGSSFGNLVAGGANAAILGAPVYYFPPLYQGALKVQGQVSGSGQPVISLPASFNFSPSVAKSLVVIWAKLPTGRLMANSFYGLCGAGTGSGASTQWAVAIHTNASGDIDYLRFLVRGTTENIICDLSGEALTELLGSQLHQLGFAFEIKNGVGITYIYVDNVLKATGQSKAILNYTQPGGTPSMFSAPGYSSISGTNIDARLGRISCHDLTNRPDLSFGDILLKDKISARGYVF